MIGQQVGNYKVISLLGSGGMGDVFLAEHVTIGTRVAIKVLQASISKDQEQVNRFFNEAKAVSKVRHAGPVKIFDCGFHEASGQRVAYLAMEYLEGESLAARIKRLGTLPGEQVAEIGRQIAGVLDAVHTAGITHRDLKPDNIFLCPDHELPSGERVKVLDFGIAKLTGTMAGPQTKGTMGTPAYMAPEQWNNSASVDGRADCYSLGCVMFEMAVGQPPFPSRSIGEACNHHLNTPPPRASQVIHAIPPEFDTLLDRMLSKTVDQRPTIKEVARAFDTLRTSGATQRWQAAAVSGIQATVVPGTLLGSQPYLGQLGSQPSISPSSGSQPGQVSGQHGSQPGPVSGQHGSQPNLAVGHGAPAAQFTAQASASYPAPAPYPTPQYAPTPYSTPQHATYPTPQHAQHQTPHHQTPQHQTPHDTPHRPPPTTSSGSKMGLWIALGAVVLVGSGIAAVVVVSGDDESGPVARSDKPAGPDKPVADKPATGPDLPEKQFNPDRPPKVDKPDKPVIGGGMTDGKGSADPPPGKPAPSKRDQIVAKNAFVDRGGVSVLSSQITASEYELVLGKLPDGVTRPADPAAPVASLTQPEAAAFCAAIGARLPTSDEWAKAAKGAWGIAVDAVAGPLQEWTSTIQDDLVVVRGGHAALAQAQLDRAARSKPPYFLQKEPSGTDRKVASAPTIGFRCVDGKATADAEAPPAPPKVGLITGGDRKVLDKIIGSDLDKSLGSFKNGSGGFGTGTGKAANRPGSVATGGATVKGSISAEAVRAVVQRNMGAIKFCYERELLKRPTLEGKVVLSFVIGPTGDVTSATATGLDPTVGSCITRVIRRAKFPAPNGVVTINYPFIFKPS